ncbi:hypothetical protein GCM10022222_48980 [Amycolatopsis ultiminotia]|uniref:Uncharacterized protein n=1 Tax=Amycolatopsis ultiminotia TaxID=543629 RepID=A0ABP6X0E5_9PSEU
MRAWRAGVSSALVPGRGDRVPHKGGIRGASSCRARHPGIEDENDEEPGATPDVAHRLLACARTIPRRPALPALRTKAPTHLPEGAGCCAVVSTIMATTHEFKAIHSQGRRRPGFVAPIRRKSLQCYLIEIYCPVSGFAETVEHRRRGR